ncbi:IS200/IS605 family accessory protein TnpB-related protein [Thermovorax subterraneus]|nr:IS200/IS605 family accessory protein TnpB-related protein [Thermovorax subterraneus]
MDIRDKGKKGDFSGRKSRRIRHSFSYRSLIEKIKVLAKRKGIQIIEVNPAYTSLIGMLKYAPQYMISKDVAAAYVIARRGLGLKEQIPEGYMAILKDLDAYELGELKEHVKRTVRNKQLKKRQLKEIERAIRLLQSLGSELEKALIPLDGTSISACSEGYKLWRVLKVAVVTPLSPGKVLRDVSVLKGVLHSGQVGRPG